jgi:hypothetical protein
VAGDAGRLGEQVVGAVEGPFLGARSPLDGVGGGQNQSGTPAQVRRLHSHVVQRLPAGALFGGRVPLPRTLRQTPGKCFTQSLTQLICIGCHSDVGI